MRILFAMSLVAMLASCESMPLLGAVCSRASDCAAMLTCQFGRCRSECAENRDCPTGASCLVDPAAMLGACSVDADLGCETGVGRECPAGLVCAGDRCVRGCRDAGDCPTDGECRAVTTGGVSFCFDPRVAGDAGVPADTGARTDGGPVAQTTRAAQVCFLDALAACARLEDGRVVCWGGGHNGSLGDGDATDHLALAPTFVVDSARAEITHVESLACGDDFACAYVGSDPSFGVHHGHVLCWGFNLAQSWGTDGLSTSAAELTPPLEAPGVRLSASGRHACALDTSTQRLRCWGVNAGLIDLAASDEATFASPFEPTVGVAQVQEIVVARGGACVIRGEAARSVTCWGDNGAGQGGVEVVDHAGLEPPIGATSIQAATGELQSVYVLVSGWGHRAALTSGATPMLVTWGTNAAGQLGESGGFVTEPCDGELGSGDVCRSIATSPSGAPDFAWIAADGGGSATCGILASSHTVECFGDNLYGQAGVAPARVPFGAPVELEAGGALGPVDVDRLALWAGRYDACAARVDGTLWCWGANQGGQLALEPDGSTHRAVRIPLP